jgi:hypothetical protein
VTRSADLVPPLDVDAGGEISLPERTRRGRHLVERDQQRPGEEHGGGPDDDEDQRHEVPIEGGWAKATAQLLGRRRGRESPLFGVELGGLTRRGATREALLEGRRIRPVDADDRDEPDRDHEHLREADEANLHREAAPQQRREVHRPPGEST